jgi:hypothetical protein
MHFFNKNVVKKGPVAMLLGAGIFSSFFGHEANAVDWIMATGTEPAKVSHRFFGAGALSYNNYFGCDEFSGMMGGAAAINGYLPNQCRVGPNLDHDDKGFNLDALMVGARGNIIPGKINYFVTANFGNNAATHRPLETDRDRIFSLTDASVTFSYIPGARVRLGLFAKPGPEELMESLKVKNFTYVTDFVRRNQIERFVDGAAKGVNPIAGEGYTGSISRNGEDVEFGKEWGIQVFDSFKTGKWKHTYAAMLGKGDGMHLDGNNNDGVDVNLYFSTEYDLPGGKGPMKNGVKLYAYHQDGERHYITDAQGTKSKDFDRTRYGAGVKAQGRFFGGGLHRFGVDMMYAKGMILQSATGSCTDCPWGGFLQVASDDKNKAKGITVSYGYHLNKSWQFDARYSRNNLLYETQESGAWTSLDERKITETALGVSYHFTPKTRLTTNYVFRDVKAPNADSSNPAASHQNALNGAKAVGDYIGLRLTHFF